MIYGELEDWSRDGYDQFEHDGSLEFDLDPYLESNDTSYEDDEIPF